MKTLSDKIHDACDFGDHALVISEVDVFEAVRELKKRLVDNEFKIDNDKDVKCSEEIINKVFGEKLI